VIFVGDLVDRGPSSAGALRIAMAMTASGAALAVPGNHDDKLRRWLEGRNVQLKHDLAATADELRAEPESFRLKARDFFARLPSHLWLDGGRLVVTHAGIRPSMIGQASARVRDFCLYGDTGGGTDEHGLPVRYDWALLHPGEPAIVYGHTPVREAAWRNNTLCIDTGAVYGGALTALRWPEREILQVPSATAYAETKRWGHPPPRP
jgi:protein phosphatase